jgi:hypothetical protein
MQSRKETAWKKSRKFGDLKGGRMRPKLADNIFARAHSLQRPSAGHELPIYITDNPSRDYFFPIGPDEIQRELAHLPRKDWSRITHIWFRRFKKAEYEANELPLAEFSCGSGVHLITIYPWPRSLEWYHGHKKPTAPMCRLFDRYGSELVARGGEWISKWEESSLKDFYIEYLLFHEIGHHVDRYSRTWSKANHRSLEEAADQYAFSKTTKRSITYRAKQERPSGA